VSAVHSPSPAASRADEVSSDAGSVTPLATVVLPRSPIFPGRSGVSSDLGASVRNLSPASSTGYSVPGFKGREDEFCRSKDVRELVQHFKKEQELMIQNLKAGFDVRLRNVEATLKGTVQVASSTAASLRELSSRVTHLSEALEHHFPNQSVKDKSDKKQDSSELSKEVQKMQRHIDHLAGELVASRTQSKQAPANSFSSSSPRGYVPDRVEMQIAQLHDELAKSRYQSAEDVPDQLLTSALDMCTARKAQSDHIIQLTISVAADHREYTSLVHEVKAVQGNFNSMSQQVSKTKETVQNLSASNITLQKVCRVITEMANWFSKTQELRDNRDDHLQRINHMCRDLPHARVAQSVSSKLISTQSPDATPKVPIRIPPKKEELEIPSPGPQKGLAPRVAQIVPSNSENTGQSFTWSGI